MCAGNTAAISQRLGMSQPSQNSSNYGYGSADKASVVSSEERQWYIDQGFGDPMSVAGQRASTSGRFASPGSPGYYQGVSAEARYLYKQRQPTKVAPAPIATPAGGTSGVTATPPSITRWAGNALTINPVTS